MPAATTTPAWVANLVAQCQQGYALPRSFYIEPEVFNLDIERVFLRNWIYAGHVSSIPRAGDYFLYDLAEESIIVIRGERDTVHAMFNVCRHRGSRVCIEEYGAAKKKLVCPYHSWTYATDGTLIGAPGTPAGFDKSAFGLRPLHVRVVEGLIFVCAADPASAFDEIERDLSPILSPFGLAETRIAYHRRYLCPAHWKLLHECFLERCGGGAKFAEFRQLFADTQPPEGVDIVLSPSRNHWCGRFALKTGHRTATRSGQPAAPLLGDFKQYDSAVVWAQVLSSWFVIANDHAVLIRFTPIDPKVTEMDVTWLVRENAVEAVDYESENIAWLWKATIEQTLKVCSDQQNGVMSRHYEPGPLGAGEERIAAFVEWYLKQVGE
jgi:phenylpropionate dioxygenase-like ring-hydroxylating dioxygenase large terminal subunit